jgi:hypothetical protein
MKLKLGRAITATATAALACAAFASPASASLLTASASSCGDQSLSQPFAAYGDGSQYKRVAGGDFESGAAGWTLTGGAKVVAGNESAKVGGASDGSSLSLPFGSTATSPAACVGLGEPTLRLFAKRNSGLLTTLSVSVELKTSLGLSLWVPVLPGDLGGGTWHPTAAMPMVVNDLTLSSTDLTPVRFRFTPVLGSWQIDDVYVDPFMKR